MFLILGGTGRARQLAARLAAEGRDAVTSTAGRTVEPLAVAGETRVGGFGGVAGMVEWLRRHRPLAVVDATHPYAAQISANAVAACAEAGVALCRYETPSWRAHPDSADWAWVGSHEAAAAEVAGRDGAILLTVGRQPLRSYLALADELVLARMVDAPDLPLPRPWRVLAQRGPFELADELRLLAGPPAVGSLVTKDSGGSVLDPKLVAAGQLGVRVVVVSRPALPVPDVELTTQDEVVAWLDRFGA